MTDNLPPGLSTAIGAARQGEIYLNGMMGNQKPLVPVDSDQLEASAQRIMSPEGFAYVAGGAGRELTVAANRSAFERWQIVPRMLNNVAERDGAIELFERTLRAPLLLAPIGVQELAHKEADLATARAAAAEAVPMIFSNQASVAMEETAAAMGDAPRWFQLYWGKSNDLVASLVSRAEKAGCDAIVVTLDTTLLGWRTRDLDFAYLPFLEAKGIAQYTSDPVFRAMLEKTPEEDPGEVGFTPRG